MHKLLCVVLTLLVVVGCEDPEAKKRAEASRQFDEVVAAFNDVEQGYAPKGEADYSAYRQQQLEKVASDLNKLNRADGVTKQQKVAVGQMQAAISATKARYLAKQAANNWADVGNKAGILATELLNVDQADRRARAFDRDESAQIEKLTADRNAAEAKLPTLEQDIVKLQKQIDQIAPQIEKYREEADALRMKARQFEDDAFIKSGTEHHDLMDKATVLDRQASAASAKADTLAVELDVVESKLELVRQQLALTGEDVKQFARQIEEARQRNRLYQDERAAALKDREATIKKLGEELAVIVEAYENNVNQVYLQAGEQISESIEKLDSVVGRAGRDRKQIELDLLMTRTAKAYILTQHALATRSMVGTLNTMADHTERLLNGLGDTVAAQIDKLTAVEKQILEDAQKTVTVALEDAADLGGEGDDPEDVAANRSKEQLAGYSSQLGLEAVASATDEADDSTQEKTGSDDGFVFE